MVKSWINSRCNFLQLLILVGSFTPPECPDCTLGNDSNSCLEYVRTNLMNNVMNLWTWECKNILAAAFSDRFWEFWLHFPAALLSRRRLLGSPKCTGIALFNFSKCSAVFCFSSLLLSPSQKGVSLKDHLRINGKKTTFGGWLKGKENWESSKKWNKEDSVCKCIKFFSFRTWKGTFQTSCPGWDLETPLGLKILKFWLLATTNTVSKHCLCYTLFK